MAPSSRDRLSVDLQGLKDAVMARAQAQGLSVSVLVRRAIERELELCADTLALASAKQWTACDSIVKLSIRLTRSEAEQLDAGARRAGLSRGAFLAGLLVGVPSLCGASSSRLDCMAALNASSAELSTLSRNIHHLTTLLREGNVRPAQEYRRMLDTLGDDVRAHLSLAAGVLADLRPARPSARHGGARPHPAS